MKRSSFSFGTNIVANLLNRGVVAVIGLLLPPYFVKWMGAEAYGLVGLYISISSLLMLLNGGLSAVLNRELARLSDMSPEHVQRMRDFVRTHEAFFWLFGGIAALLCSAAAPFIADHWVHRETLSSQETTRAVRLIGVLAGLQWPLSLYDNVLANLEHQVLENTIQTIWAVFRAVTTVVILVFFTHSINAYFSVQIVVTLVLVVALGSCVRLHLGRGGVVQSRLLLHEKGFALGAWGVLISSILIMQLDRVLISKLMPLEALGAYSLVCAIAGSLYFAASPVYNASLPRFTRLAANEDTRELADVYHAATQVTSVLIGSPCFVICFFSTQILAAWLRGGVSEPHLATVLVLLAAGTAIRGFMFLPLALSTNAYKWTSLNLRFSVALVCVTGPLECLLIRRMGLSGGALGWLLCTMGYLFVYVPLMHRRILRGELLRWYGRSLLIPLLPSLVVVIAAKLALPPVATRAGLVAELGVVLAFGVTASIVAVPALRKQARARLVRLQA